MDTWLDGRDEVQAAAIAEAFRPFWESAEHAKVWHNYSFDRHVLERRGFRLRGFAADTMHMARLWDSSRAGRGGYSLEALSSDAALMGEGRLGDENAADTPVRGKVSMKALFGKPNVKADGTYGKVRSTQEAVACRSSQHTQRVRQLTCLTLPCHAMPCHAMPCHPT